MSSKMQSTTSKDAPSKAEILMQGLQKSSNFLASIQPVRHRKFPAKGKKFKRDFKSQQVQE